MHWLQWLQSPARHFDVNLPTLTLCSLMKSGGSFMCLQDVKVGDKGVNVARCLFDGGSEATLILDSFARA